MAAKAATPPVMIPRITASDDSIGCISSVNSCLYKYTASTPPKMTPAQQQQLMRLSPGIAHTAPMMAPQINETRILSGLFGIERISAMNHELPNRIKEWWKDKKRENTPGENTREESCSHRAKMNSTD